MVVRKEGKYLFVNKVVRENTQTKTSHVANSKLFVNIFSRTLQNTRRIVNTIASILLVYLPLDIICSSSKGYRPEARGYVIYSPRALPEGNKSQNHELKADKWLIFTYARIPQGMQKYTEEKWLYSCLFCFQHSMLALVGFTSFSAF